MNKLKVIQVVPELESGGVERGTLEVARFLVSDGHESVVVSGGGRLVNRLESEGSRHVNWRLGEKSLLTLRHVRPFRRFLENERPDILHLRSRCPAWIAWLAWRKMDPATRPRLVTTVHGFNSVNRYSKIMTCGERVIVVSNSVADFIRQNYPDVSEEKIRVIHRGVDPQEYPYGYRPPEEWLRKWKKEYPGLEGRIVLTLPGRITRLKGHEDFCSIVASLQEKGMPVHGLIVGDAHPRKQAYLQELRAKVATMGLADVITFTGLRSDLREIMAVSHAVLSLKAEPEAFGRTTLEALSLGVPVVGYSHAGIAEQMEPLFPEGAVGAGDTEAVVDRIESWGQNPPRPQRMSPFTLEAMLRKTLEVYEELTVIRK